MTFIPSRITIVLSHCLTAFEGKIHAELTFPRELTINLYVSQLISNPVRD